MARPRDRLFQYIKNRDYIGVQGLITFFALAVVVISLLIDIVNAMIDPRVRYEHDGHHQCHRLSETPPESGAP